MPSHSSGPMHLAKPVHAAESVHTTAGEWSAVKVLSKSHTEVVVIHLMEMIEVMETIDKDETRAHADEKRRPPIPGVRIRVGRDRVHEHATIWALYDLPCPVRLQARAQVVTAVARCALRSSRPRGDPCALSGNVAGRVGICGVQADASRNSSVRSSHAAVAPRGTSPSQTSKTRSNRRDWGAAGPCSCCTRKGIGRHPWAWFPASRSCSADKSTPIREYWHSSWPNLTSMEI